MYGIDKINKGMNMLCMMGLLTQMPSHRVAKCGGELLEPHVIAISQLRADSHCCKPHDAAAGVSHVF